MTTLDTLLTWAHKFTVNTPDGIETHFWNLSRNTLQPEFYESLAEKCEKLETVLGITGAAEWKQAILRKEYTLQIVVYSSIEKENTFKFWLYKGNEGITGLLHITEPYSTIQSLILNELADVIYRLEENIHNAGDYHAS